MGKSKEETLEETSFNDDLEREVEAIKSVAQILHALPAMERERALRNAASRCGFIVVKC